MDIKEIYSNEELVKIENELVKIFDHRFVRLMPASFVTLLGHELGNFVSLCPSVLWIK